MNVSSVEQNKPRLQYIDTAKGILKIYNGLSESGNKT